MKPISVVIVVVIVVVVACASGCSIDAEDLPGRPCERAADCGSAFACARVPGQETSVCVPAPPPEEVVGCDGADEGDPCGDGNACTEDDVCRGGVCVGDEKDCGDDLCVAGICEVVGSCEALSSTIVLSQAQAPRLAANALDGELGVTFEAAVLDRTEVFFARLRLDGSAAAAPVQLTDGTPATQDDAPVSSSVRDIVFAPEERRYGVLTGDAQFLSSGIRFFALTQDGIVVDDTSITRELASGFGQVPARLDWTGAEFVIAARIFQSEQDTIILDDVDADAAGADLIDAVIARGSFIELDIAARRGTGEVGVVFVTVADGAAVDVRFVRADSDGDVLVERTLTTGRPPGRAPAIAATPSGYVVVWQEGEGDARALVATTLDAAGATSTPPTVISETDEGAQLPSVTAFDGGAAVAYFAAVDGAFAVRVRRLSSTLIPSAPVTLRDGLGSGFAPSVDVVGDGVVVGFGGGDDDVADEVELAVSCELP